MHSYLRSHCSSPSESEVKKYKYYYLTKHHGKKVSFLKLRILHISEIWEELSSGLEYRIRYTSVIPSVCYIQQNIVIYWEARVLVMSDLRSLNDFTSSRSIHHCWINGILISWDSESHKWGKEGHIKRAKIDVWITSLTDVMHPGILTNPTKRYTPFL